MAVLNATTLRWLRNRIEQKANEKGVKIDWVKSQVNAALQAIEDRWEAPGTQTALSNDIETAAPGVFTLAEKRYLIRYWLSEKGDREEASL